MVLVLLVLAVLAVLAVLLVLLVLAVLLVAVVVAVVKQLKLAWQQLVWTAVPPPCMAARGCHACARCYVARERA